MRSFGKLRMTNKNVMLSHERSEGAETSHNVKQPEADKRNSSEQIAALGFPEISIRYFGVLRLATRNLRPGANFTDEVNFTIPEG